MKKGDLGLHNQTRHTPHYRWCLTRIQSKIWITVIALVLPQVLIADSRWVRLKGPGLEVLSGAGAPTGREVLLRMGQIRHVIETRAGSQNLTPLPVRVIVFPSERAFAPFRITTSNAGYFASGIDRDYVVMRADAPDLYRVVFHEYVHLVLHRAGVQAPAWFDEGTAEIYSTSDLGTRDVRIGQPVPAHVALLKSTRLMPLPDLFRVIHASPEYNERDKNGLFYAESWALAHMLNFAPAYRPAMPGFVELVLAGTASEQALASAFHKSPEAVFSDLTSYIERGIYTSLTFPTPRLERATKLEAEPLAETESDLALADLLLAIHRPDAAEDFVRKATARHSTDPEYEAALGDIALERKQDESARHHFERAIQLGSKSARLRLDYAMVLRELHAPTADVAAALQEALRLDPNLSHARELLETTQLQVAPERLRILPKPAPVDSPKPSPTLANASGTLMQVDCLGSKARLRLEPHLFLLLTETSKVKGVPVELSCGPVNKPVVVEYRPTMNETYGTSGEVATIEFR